MKLPVGAKDCHCCCDPLSIWQKRRTHMTRSNTSHSLRQKKAQGSRATRHGRSHSDSSNHKQCHARIHSTAEVANVVLLHPTFVSGQPGFYRVLSFNFVELSTSTPILFIVSNKCLRWSQTLVCHDFASDREICSLAQAAGTQG